MSERTLLPVASGRDAARRSWRLLRSRPGWLAVTVSAFVVAGLAGLVPVLMIGRVVDAVGSGGDRDDVVQAVAWMVAAGIVAAGATALSTASLARVVAPSLARLREDVLDRALHLETERVEAAGIGDVVSRVGDDVRQVTESLDEAVPATLSSVVTLVFTVGGLFTLDWRLGLAGLAATPFYLGAVRWYVPHSGPMYREERRAQGERADALVTGVHGAETMRAFGRERHAIERVERASAAAVDVALRVYVMFTRFGFRMNLSELVGLGAVLVAGYWTVSSGAGSIGDATAAALFFHRLFNPIGALLFLFDTVQAAGAALTRLVGVADLPGPEPTRLDPRDADLHLVDVEHAYEPGHRVLAPVSLHLPAGRVVAVVGATGAGKTTLGAIAAGALRPSGGRVLLGGQDLASVDESQVRRHIALVTQEVHVFAGTVRDNLRLAGPDATDPELWDALATALARAWVEALPRGLDTVVGDRGHRLTAPQAQQLALARIVLADPRVVVLDEATAEAGSSGARELEQAALRVLAGRSAVVIAHRLTQTRDADEVVVLHHGEVVERGSHDELVARAGRYADLWRAWSVRA
ncbi:ABC transporter permease [Aeromicrobium flavum]|uniref:ABC transporter permease n=1 Tax=Aeromicrobium flavum TaxID=416568 RepID=A0A512HX82_9ACTN|nr:ABC transporter ATP-binding protein [Aeromicrobium flavum]GEO90065.1 ABC transporter permease [Aeromicrobium flavum]